jgi:outer membrane murein-binding lipoprotein Lpp
MKKICEILFVLLVFGGCNQQKIDQLEYSLQILSNKNEELVAENIKLKKDIELLATEIQSLKETDQYYYQCGADEYTNKNYDLAIDWMEKLKLKFPDSSLLSVADKLIRDSKNEIVAIYLVEQNNLNQILRNARNVELEDGITLLKKYTKEEHPSDLIQQANVLLAQFENRYEAEREVRELERSVGIRLVDYVTGWGNINDFGSEMYVPQMMLKFQNISGWAISTTINIKTNFVEVQKNEIFGDSSDYLLSFSDTPLQANYSKTIFVDCGRGYRGALSEYKLQSLPSLEAHIYINDKIYKKFTIQKKFRGNL